jgi:hypothetical protein
MMKKIGIGIFILISTFCNAQNINLINNGNFGYYTYDSALYLKDTIATSKNHCWFEASGRCGIIWPNKVVSHVITSNPISRSDSNTLNLYSEVNLKYRISTAVIDTVLVNYRAFAQTQLIKPLTAGKTYYFTMYVGGILNDGVLVPTDILDTKLPMLAFIFQQINWPILILSVRYL